MRKQSFISHSLMAFALLSGGMLLGGCSTDDNIDLSEIDSNIGLTADGLTLPASSTNYILLADVLDLKEDGVIKILENGDYQFQKADDISAAKPKVKQVTFNNNTTLNDVSIPINVNVGYLPAGWEKETLPSYDLTVFEYSSVESTSIASLKEAIAKSGTISLKLYLSTLKSYLTSVSAKFTLPYYLKFKSTSMGTISRDDTNKKQYLLLDDISTATDQTIDLVLDELVGFESSVPSGKTEYIVVNQNGIDLKGNVSLELTLKESAVKPGTTTIDVNVGTHVDVSSFVLNQAKGCFDPTIDPQTSSVDIGKDVPDFLDDPQVKIKLSNPTIELDIKNNIDVEAFISGTLVATYNDKSTKTMSFTKTSTGAPITLKPHKAATGSTMSKIVICRKAGNESGVQYVVKDGTGSEAGEKDLAAILEKIPDKIDFTFNSKSNTAYEGSITLYDPAQEGDESKPGLSYKIEPKYDFKAPLSLDKGSTIVYNDTINDWNKDIADNDINLAKGGTIKVDASIINRTPMKLYIVPVPIDVNKKEINDVTVSINTGSSDAKGEYVISTWGTDNAGKLEITIKSNNESSLKKLDGLILKVTAETVNSDITLNSGTKYVLDDKGNDKTVGNKAQIVKIYDMKVSVNGTITVNLDK